MNNVPRSWPWLLSITLHLVLVTASSAADTAHGEREQARAALLQALKSYEPGQPITSELETRIDAAARRLEETAAPPDLVSKPGLVRGLWVNLFSTQGIVGEIDVSFMTRTLPGGGREAGKARALAVLQELDPERQFYRNTMTMEVGASRLPMLYLATAQLALSPESPSVLEVLFYEITFAPARADVTLEALREALGLPGDTPLSISIPVTPQRSASTSTVTYLDEDLRINRGKDYFAVLRRVE